MGASAPGAEALHVEQALVTALREEPQGVSPGPETAALHAALLEPAQPGDPGSPAPNTIPYPRQSALRHNLPAAISSFVGRWWERAELRHLLDRTRLLTLTGPGGCGKTRLALTLAEERAAARPDDVRLVELAPIGTSAEVTQATLRALALREEAGVPLLDTITAHLADHFTLLVLDNCEHLLEACAELANGLLRACPRLRILATSRERLGSPGRRSGRFPPLSLPTPEGESSLTQSAQAEAIQLLVERVHSVRTGFALTTRNAAAVIQICRRLDGIPLALELVAARAATLGRGADCRAA